MKIYTSTFDLAYPSNARFWVAPNSDFKIGLKIVNKGEEYTGNFALKSGSTTFTADSDKTAGFTTYTIKSLGTGAVTYEIDVPGAQQKFTLMQIVTDSTVFEVGALSGGGDVPADVATQTWVNEQISDFITEDDLTGYATQDELTAKADVSSLTAYAEVTSLTAYATTDELTAYATQNDLTSKADVSSLTAYAEASALNNVSLSVEGALTAIADINENQIPGINSTLGICVTHQPSGEAPEVFQITTAYESEWETLSADTDENTMYVILPDPVTP